MKHSSKVPRMDLTGEIYPETVRAYASEMKCRLARHRKAILRATRSCDLAVATEIEGTWTNALQSCELVIYQAARCGEQFMSLRSQDDRPRAYKFEALLGLHSNAVRISKEILCLLRSGYANGAHARWRSLYEYAVIADFVAKEADDIAERFLDHEIVKAYEQMQSCQRHCELANEPFPEQNEMDSIKRQVDAVGSKYGQDFLGQFGWAKPGLQRRNPGRKGGVNFEDIENATDMELWRSPYKLASHAVHPTAFSLGFDMGLDGRNEVDRVRPTSFGLAEPGVETVSSLLLVTDALTLGALLRTNALRESLSEQRVEEWVELSMPLLRLQAMERVLSELVRVSRDEFEAADKEHVALG